MKIVFMGTPDFAVPSLEKLISEFGVEAVLTQPDKQRGRGKKVTYSPVKEVAVEHNIEVMQPTRLRKDTEVIERLKEIKPDFMIVVAYGQILSKEVLDIPKYGCINLHGSLLPKYRGAAPINWAIMKGEKVSGNTTMLMDVGLDTGDMLLKQTVDITDDMTAGELYNILKDDGAELLVNTIKGMVSGEIVPEKQNEEETCYASMLDKKMAEVNWALPSLKVHNLVRGLNPWPIAYTTYDGVTMKIYETEVINKESGAADGTILKVSNEGMEISCGEGALLIKKIQFPNKRPMSVEDYLRGNALEEGIILGD